MDMKIQGCVCGGVCVLNALVYPRLCKQHHWRLFKVQVKVTPHSRQVFIFHQICQYCLFDGNKLVSDTHAKFVLVYNTNTNNLYPGPKGQAVEKSQKESC